MHGLSRHCSIQDLGHIRGQAALCPRPIPDVVCEVPRGSPHGQSGPMAEDHVLGIGTTYGPCGCACAPLPHRASHPHPLQHLAHHHQPLLRHWLPAVLRLRHSSLISGQLTSHPLQRSLHASSPQYMATESTPWSSGPLSGPSTADESQICVYASSTRPHFLRPSAASGWTCIHIRTLYTFFPLEVSAN